MLPTWKRMSLKPRSRIRRQPKKARYEREFIDAVLDRGMVAHVAFAHDDQPYCIPMLHARIGDELFIHGSTASRLVRTLAAGAAACVTVTIVKGLVLARSAFEHSANFDSVVLLGRFRAIEDPDQRLAALEAFTNKLVPGRWDEVRGPNRKEMKATQILAMPIAEASAKTRSGPPDDDDSADAALDTWAGEVPIVTGFGEPVPSPGLRPDIPVAASVRRLAA
jgi:nitroimidazol reductase NimA-like FMN-containing flavoprotein (pyridoxamine 5'-phosphate oxidase superfamily)